MRRALASLVLSLLPQLACAYPRHSTPLSAVPPEALSEQTLPQHLWRLTLLSAHMPEQKRSGLSWDDDGGGPDPYLAVYLDGRLAWKSPTAENTTHPRFHAGPGHNLAFDRSRSLLRLELWDQDATGSDPIGSYEGRVLASAPVGTELLVALEGGATIALRLDDPLPHAGTGIALFEVRPDALIVLDVWPRSPASRAGIEAGDRILAIDGQRVATLDERRARTALTLSQQRKSPLLVVHGKQPPREVVLDRGYVWLSR